MLDGECTNCGRSSPLISQALNLCLDCIRGEPKRTRLHAELAHIKARKEFDMPPKPPREASGVRCRMCANQCQIPLGERGYCGLRENRNGVLHHINVNTMVK